jgi:hypothetical protein
MKTYKTLWIIIGIVALALVAVLAYGLSLKKTQDVGRRTQDETTIGLGELGAICGGEKRLPCKPGLNCIFSRPQSTEGVCQKISNEVPGKTEPLK